LRRRARDLDAAAHAVHHAAMTNRRSFDHRFGALVALVLAVGASTARAQAPPLVGEWRWNPTESTTAPDDPAPRNLVLAITAADPAHVQWTMTGTDAKGRRKVQSYEGPGDGRLAPVNGGPDGTMAAFTISGSAMTITYTDRGGRVREQTSCAVAAGGHRMTCQGNLLDGLGHAVSFRDVYDRR
jgi:hypothetical protein